MVWYGMVWYGMAWCGMVWYGMVWYGMEPQAAAACTPRRAPDKQRWQSVAITRHSILLVVDIADAIRLLDYLFGTGHPPDPCSDSNNDGATDVADAVYLLAYLFSSGLPPAGC